MIRKSISFRLRKIDADLVEAIEGLDSEALSELCRDGLRLILGIRTTKRVEVMERALVIPEDRKKAVTVPATVYVSPNLRKKINDRTESGSDSHTD